MINTDTRANSVVQTFQCDVCPESNSKLSDIIYQVLRIQDGVSLLLTMPNPEAAVLIPESYQMDPPTGQDKIGLVFQNNGFMSVRTRWKTPMEYGDYLERVRPEALEKIAHLSRNDQYNKIDNLLSTIQEIMKIDELSSEKREEFLTKDITYNIERVPSFAGVLFEGKRMCLRHTQEKLSEFVKSFDQSPFIYRGEFIYRSVRDHEWEWISQNQMMLLRSRDNFEGEVGNQVKYFKDEKGYAGVIVRVPNKQPYNGKAGITVPRISTLKPHFIGADEIYVSKTGENDSFIPLKDFIDQESAVS